MAAARMGVAIAHLRLLENRDEHRRNILQKVFRLGAIEKGGVLPQFVRHLINDESAARARARRTSPGGGHASS